MRHQMIVKEPTVDGASNCLVVADQAGDLFGAGGLGDGGVVVRGCQVMVVVGGCRRFALEGSFAR